MRFYGGFKYKCPSKGRRDRLWKKSLGKLKRDLLLVPIPFLEPDKSPSPVTLSGPVWATISTAFITQAEEMVHEMRDLCHQWDCLAQEEDKAEKEWERMSCWVSDLLDQRVDLKGELWRLEQDLKSKNKSWHSLRPERKSWRSLV